jgi:two-component system cell cycle response regulator DivK
MSEESLAGARARAPLVLVADDYPDAQWAYGLWLRRAGYRVAFASSGEEAVMLARELHPDAVIMDLCLRGSDGSTATREIRADPAMGDIPVVAVTGYAGSEYERLAYDCGCDLFVTKTCPVETLQSILHGLIARTEVLSSGIRLRVAEAHDGFGPEERALSTG